MTYGYDEYDRVTTVVNAAGCVDHGCDAIILVVAVGHVGTFGCDRAGFSAAFIVSVDGHLPVAVRRRHDIAVGIIGHGLAVAVGINDPHDAALPGCDPSVRIGPVVGGD